MPILIKHDYEEHLIVKASHCLENAFLNPPALENSSYVRIAEMAMAVVNGLAWYQPSVADGVEDKSFIIYNNKSEKVERNDDLNNTGGSSPDGTTDNE